MRRLLMMSLLTMTWSATAGTMDLFVDLNLTTNNGFKSLASYSWTTGFFDFDPNSFDMAQQIGPGVADYSLHTTAFSTSHNLTGFGDTTPPVCFQASIAVTVNYVLMASDTFTKSSNEICYQGPPPPSDPPSPRPDWRMRDERLHGRFLESGAAGPRLEWRWCEHIRHE